MTGRQEVLHRPQRQELHRAQGASHRRTAAPDRAGGYDARRGGEGPDLLGAQDSHRLRPGLPGVPHVGCCHWEGPSLHSGRQRGVRSKAEQPAEQVSAGLCQGLQRGAGEARRAPTRRRPGGKRRGWPERASEPRDHLRHAHPQHLQQSGRGADVPDLHPRELRRDQAQRGRLHHDAALGLRAHDPAAHRGLVRGQPRAGRRHVVQRPAHG